MKFAQKKNIKYQAIHWAINALFTLSVALTSLGGTSVVVSVHSSLLVTREVVEIIILIIITMIIFKNKY